MIMEGHKDLVHGQLGDLPTVSPTCDGAGRLTRDACEDCRRRKSKCTPAPENPRIEDRGSFEGLTGTPGDMARPVCTQCTKAGRNCVFLPSKRKLPKPPQHTRIPRNGGKRQKLDRLLSLLESGIEQRLSHEGPLPNLRQPTVHTAVPRQPPAALEQMPEPEGQVNIVGNYGSMSWPSDGSQRTEHGLSPEAPPGDDPSVLTIHHVDLPTLEDDALYLEPLPFMDMGWNPGILHQDLDPTSGTEELDTSLELESTLMEPTLLPISRTIFSELLDMFLAKVHGFLPLFHLPTFVDEITRSLSAATPDTGTSRTEAAFILNGMFALSARFSMHDDFRDAAALSRGEPFARRAVDIFDRHLADSQEAPNLRILQGHILLACYYLSSGISSRAWRFTGMCVRMLYELNIHKVDHHHAIEGYVETPEEWVKTEEKRRAWWSAWELDNFASTVACRPFCCDRQVEVLLPVSDEDWFAGKPVRSAFLWTNRRAAWEGLADCENQAERAWFLVAVHLIRLATDITTLSSMESSSQRQNELETAMTCFRLALPPKFDLSCLFFKGDNWSNAAWAVSTHIMFQSACSYYLLWKSKTKEHRGSPQAPESSAEEDKTDYRIHANEVVEALRRWDPRYMPFSPFLACSILGPQSSHLQHCAVQSSADKPADLLSPDPNLEIVRLCLKRHARYWELGSLLLEVVRINAKLGGSTSGNELSPEERQFLDRLPILAVL